MTREEKIEDELNNLASNIKEADNDADRETLLVGVVGLLLKEIAALNDTMREAWIFPNAEEREVLAPARRRRK